MPQTTQQKENNSQFNHLNSSPNKEENEENEVFDLVLVDICNIINDTNIKCVKKNMYDPELKYICISYRWGELNEQQLETPDYTAHITSFLLYDLKKLCVNIKYEPDLCEIRYLWIDAISVDQQNRDGKKDTILKMNQIYQHATYILAVPDLHLEYLKKNTANCEIIALIENKYSEAIYNEIFDDKHPDNTDSINDKNDDNESLISTNYMQQQQHTSNNYYTLIQKLKNMNINKDIINKMEELEIANKEKEKEMKELNIENKELKKENKELKTKKIDEEKKKIYQFLAYLIEDWSNRAWVISEYHVAKDKYINHGVPLKYIFISLYAYDKPFYSYHFNDDDQQSAINNKLLGYGKVNDPVLFNQFVKSRFAKRTHLEMILDSNATRNEDRFNAILPSWNKYKHIIKNKNIIFDWNITDMTSVRLKLYEIMDDLWDKATLLNACKYGEITPTFASNHRVNNLNIIEKVRYGSVNYKEFEESLLEYKSKKEAIKIKQLMDEYKMNSKSIWNDNLISIQFELRYCYLSVKSKKYYIRNADYSIEEENCRIKLSLDGDDEIHRICMPFFTFNLPDYIDYLHSYEYDYNLYLIGNMNKNKWILLIDNLYNYSTAGFCHADYTFNVY